MVGLATTLSVEELDADKSEEVEEAVDALSVDEAMDALSVEEDNDKMSEDELEVTIIEELEEESITELEEEDVTELLELDGFGGGGGGIPFNFGGSALVHSLRSLMLFTPSKLRRR